MALKATKERLSMFTMYMIVLAAITTKSLAAVTYGCLERTNYCNINVEGEIADRDISGLLNALNELDKINLEKLGLEGVDGRKEGALNYLALTVTFNSVGGSVRSAMNLGRIIREKTLETTVIHGEYCLSSCVYSFLGGIKRSAEAKTIGVHAPYAYLHANDAPSEAKQKFEKLKMEITAYLSEMNVPLGILDVMLRTPTDEMYYLSEGELSELHITGEDPLWSEMLLTKAAKSKGLSRAEYQHRRTLVEKFCAPVYEEYSQLRKGDEEKKAKLKLKDYFDCVDLIYSGKKKTSHSSQ